MTFRSRILVVAWFGLATGLLDVALLAWRKLQGGWVLSGVHIVWMAPAANAILFMAVALVLSAAALRWSRLGSAAATGLVFVFLTACSMLLAFPAIAPLAAAALAAGISVQAARWIARRPDRLAPLGGAHTVRVAAVVGALAISIHVWQWASERSAVRRLPLPPAAAPNVLLVVLDTLRAESMSLYGHSRPTTPYLEKLGAASVVFDRAFSTAPWTLPSHGSMFTGRLPYELSTGWSTPLDERAPTLAEVLRSRGYVTAGFVANLVYTGRASGMDRGFIRYEDHVVSLRHFVQSSALARHVTMNETFRRTTGWFRPLEQKTAPDINAAFLRWVKSTRRPFFAFLNYFDAHTPYLPPEPFRSRFGAARPDRNPLPIDEWLYSEAVLSRDEIQVEQDAYAASIAYLDAQLGALVEELRAEGLLENTLLIITSDHGEQFGEHGLLTHGNSLYRHALEVPLVMSMPGRLPGNTRVRRPVSLRDLPATVIALVDPRGDSPFPGQSLVSMLDTPDDAANAAPVVSVMDQSEWTHRGGLPNSAGRMQSVIGMGLHYIRNGDGREELYDLERDPAERANLLDRPDHGPTLERFRAWMLKTRAAE